MLLDFGVNVQVERKVAVLRLVEEGALHGIQQGLELNVLGIHGDRSRFDLGKVENVTNQIEKVGAGAVDGAGKLHLLGQQIAVGIFAQLLAEDEDAVQGCPQLVRHIGQELRLVFGSQRQFVRLLFQRAAGLLDFLVLALHFGILFRQLRGFLGKLFVFLLQLFLLALQLRGELLGLFEQAFGLHGGFDAVQQDADAGRQLIEKRQV